MAEEDKVDSFSYYKEIWIEPRETIHRVITSDPSKGLWWLSCIYGFSWLINWVHPFIAEQQIGLFQGYFIALVLSPLAGYLVFSVWAGVIALTGKLFGGEGSYKEIRAAYAWSCFPYIVNVILWLALGIWFGKELFMGKTVDQSVPQWEVAILFVFFALRMAAWIWSWVIYINTLSEVQKFSPIKAVGNVIAATLLLGGVFYLLFYLAAVNGNKAAMILQGGL